MTTIEIAATLVRTFAVLLARKGAVEAALVALSKRAARKGIPGVLSWTWGKAYTSTEIVSVPDGCEPPTGARLLATSDYVGGANFEVNVTRAPLTLTGETPRLNGWRFIATLQHLDGENIVRCLPNEEIPPSYRTRGSMCDHCRANRRRNDTYILRHEDGRLMQVGSSCIRDFLGGDDAAMIAAKAEILALAASVAGDEGDESFGGSGPLETLIAEYLPVVAWCVRVEGWKSRTVAREQGGEATANRAWTLLTDAKARLKAQCEPTAEDIATAASAEAWAESLTDEAVNSSKSDYLHNLRATARTGLVSFRTAGIVASTVTAYQRHIGQERAKVERAARPSLDIHVGTIGAKVTFGLPPKTGKKGQPLKNSPTVLSSEPLTLDFVAGYEGAYGYVSILKFKTSEGASLVWKSTGDSGIGRADVGKQFTLSGTIKSHDTYKGEKQTALTRCDVREVAPSAPSSSEPPAPYVPPVDDYSIAS